MEELILRLKTYEKPNMSWDKEQRLQYSRTKRGLIYRIHANQRHSKVSADYGQPTYSYEELKEWLLAQQKFNKLFEDWEKSDYKTEKIPSIDRVDDYKGYSFQNIQLMTWAENKAKGHSDRKKGINNKASRSVTQHKPDGTIIATYNSIREACKKTQNSEGNVCSACRKDRGTAGGFIWKYKT